MRIGIIAFLAGVLALHQLPELPGPQAYAGLALCLALSAICRRFRHRFRWLLSVGVCCLGFSLGFCWAWFQAQTHFESALPRAWEGLDLSVTGRVLGPARRESRAWRFDLRLESLTAPGGQVDARPRRLRLTWYDAEARPRAGERWTLRVRLKRPHGYANPGGFDYEGWLYGQGIHANGYVRSDTGNLRLAPAGSLDGVRERLAMRLDRALAQARHASLIKALVLGERADMTPAQWRVLTATGTNHLLAISGLHVGLVAGLIYFLSHFVWRWLPGAPARMPAARAAAWPALLAALAYAALAGFAIPTQRALIMVGAVMAARYWPRRLAPATVLAWACLLVLLHDSSAVLAPGFWLSFAAVALIVYCMSARIGMRRAWRQLGRMQLLLGVGLVPLLLLWFQRVSLAAPLANLFAVPWVSLLVVPPALLGAALLDAWPAAGESLLKLCDLALEAMWRPLEWLAAWPGAVLSLPAPPAAVFALALVGVGMLLAPRGWPARWLGALCLLPVLLYRPASPAHGAFEFTLLDVGQGLAAVVRTRNHVLLFDTGSRFRSGFNAGDAVVIPYLREYGIRAVDMLIASHGDNDHVGGLAAVRAAMPVARILSGEPGRVQAEACERGMRWEWDGVSFQILHPLGANGAGNNRSCVLRVATRSGAVLLPGDIEIPAEQALLANVASTGAKSATDPDASLDMNLDTNLGADILVAPHHGSKTSSSAGFIDAVAPRYVLYAVGYRNRWNFPRPEVARRYTQRGIQALDSARHGAMEFEFPADRPPRPPRLYRLDARRFWRD